MTPTVILNMALRVTLIPKCFLTYPVIPGNKGVAQDGQLFHYCVVRAISLTKTLIYGRLNKNKNYSHTGRIMCATLCPKWSDPQCLALDERAKSLPFWDRESQSCATLASRLVMAGTSGPGRPFTAATNGPLGGIIT